MSEISRKILCVDDEPLVLDGLRRQLRGRFDVTTAVGGENGLALCREQGPFAVVVSDYRMPAMNGVEFLRRIHEGWPETVLVMLTGQTELSVAIAALHEGHIFRFINKPCQREVLEATLRDALEQYRLVVSERLLRQELDKTNAELLRLNANLEQLVARRTATIQSLYCLMTDLNGLESLEEVGQAIVDWTCEMSDSRGAALLLPDPAGERLVVQASAGLDPAELADVRIPPGEPLAGAVFRDAVSTVINSETELADYGSCAEPAALTQVPLAQVALLTGDGPMGVLAACGRRDGRPHDNESLAALRAVAESAAIAILNQVRRQERDDARDATILALAKLAEHRDPETGAHLERVQCYCRLLAEALARNPRYAGIITRGFISNLVRSSPLHDIGKVGIPDDILLKPGRLTPEEFEIMKRHAAIGGDTIRALIEQGRRQMFLEMGMEIAYYHHEKYDGSGYPKGLSGEAIPLPARILAVADVYDALTSKRVYKPAMPHAQAAAIIREGNGKHFDPDLVAAFLEQEAEFERLATALADALAPSPVPETAVPAGSH
ncbi:MAG: response regulator [Phycisphaerae bacterium]|jgi:response regulator RpfG family c-di-GMP phosphodiesterase